MTELIKLLHTLVKRSFWGELIVKFNSGKIVGVHQNESLDMEKFKA